MRHQIGILGVVSALALAAPAPLRTAEAAAEDWRREIAPRFGASAEIPARGFAALPDPENADGRTWRSLDDGGTIALYGGFIVVAPDFAVLRTWREETERAGGTRITYRAGGRSWFVLSGLNGGMVVYERVEVACGGDAYVAIRFDYPAATAKRWDRIVKRSAASLEAATAADCD